MAKKKAIEQQRAYNRAKWPEAAEVIDELRRLGFDPRVVYKGELRDRTKHALKLEGRADLSGGQR